MHGRSETCLEHTLLENKETIIHYKHLRLSDLNKTLLILILLYTTTSQEATGQTLVF